MNQRLAFAVIIFGVLGGYYLVYTYLIKAAKFFAFFNNFSGDGGDHSIRDRHGLLVFALKTWGVFALLPFMSFHFLWLPSSVFWIFMIAMQRKITPIWEYHDYSRWMFTLICFLVALVSFVVSSPIRNFIASVAFV